MSDNIANLDELIANYNRLFESVTYPGNAVVYERYTWVALRDAFRAIIAYKANNPQDSTQSMLKQRFDALRAS